MCTSTLSQRLGRQGAGACKQRLLLLPCLRHRSFCAGGLSRQTRAASTSRASSSADSQLGLIHDDLAPFDAGKVPSGPSGNGGLLTQLWTQLCTAAASVLRLLLVAAACWIASLAPRPAASLASSSAPVASARSMPTSSTADRWAADADGAAGLGRAHSGAGAGTSGRRVGAAAPLADLALAPAAARNDPWGPPALTSTSTPASSRRASPLTANPAQPSTTSISNNTSAGAVTGSAAAAQQPGAAGPSGAAAPGSGAGGGSAGSSGNNAGGGAAAASAPGAVLGPGPVATGPAAAAAVDPEEAALAAALGIGLAEAGVVRLFERHRASVVNISGMRAMQTFTTLDLAKMPTGQGSGFIWGDKGHVVTCYHLIKGSAEVKVTLYDNTSYTAKVLGYDAAKDIAVLKLSVPKSKLRELQPVTPGSAAGLRVGQTVYGIGNPWGLGHTLSQGMVCGLGAELSAGLFPIKGVILTQCSPDPGSSGGVLLDSKGSVVGVLVAPPASSGGGGGGGGRAFAVPLDAVRGLVGQILSYGRTVRPALGITMAPAQVLEHVGLEGVLVLEVPPGSPAHAAGLRPTHRDIFGDLVLGDIVVGLDGKAVRSSSDLYDILDEHRVGDRIKLDVLRDGKATGLTVTLGERVLGAVEE